MIILELSSYVLETPNDAYTTLSQNLIWLFNTQSRVLEADWSGYHTHRYTHKTANLTPFISNHFNLID